MEKKIKFKWLFFDLLAIKILVFPNIETKILVFKNKSKKYIFLFKKKFKSFARFEISPIFYKFKVIFLFWKSINFKPSCLPLP